MRWLRFSMRTIFVVTFVGAVFFAGYHVGFHANHVDTSDSTISRLRVVFSTESNAYPMSDRWNDLLWSCGLRKQPSTSYPLRLITTTVAPDTWHDVGGPGSMVPFSRISCTVEDIFGCSIRDLFSDDESPDDSADPFGEDSFADVFDTPYADLPTTTNSGTASDESSDPFADPF